MRDNNKSIDDPYQRLIQEALAAAEKRQTAGYDAGALRDEANDLARHLEHNVRNRRTRRMAFLRIRPRRPCSRNDLGRT